MTKETRSTPQKIGHNLSIIVMPKRIIVSQQNVVATTAVNDILILIHKITKMATKYSWPPKTAPRATPKKPKRGEIKALD